MPGASRPLNYLSPVHLTAIYQGGFLSLTYRQGKQSEKKSDTYSSDRVKPRSDYFLKSIFLTHSAVQNLDELERPHKAVWAGAREFGYHLLLAPNSLGTLSKFLHPPLGSSFPHLQIEVVSLDCEC